MADTFARARIFEGGFNTSRPITLASGSTADSIPLKEWSIADDVLNLSDTAAFTISNVDGEHRGKILVGMRVELELSDADVAQGQWVRQFTGVVTRVRYTSDMGGGSVIAITAMDVGWFLTQCCARPLTNIKHRRFKQLLELLVDPSWGIGEIVAANDTNRKLKHGRQVIVQNFKPQLGAILPYIQVEPGQTPFQIIETYAAREGVLVNAGASGELVFFRPNYRQRALYTALYTGTNDPDHAENNIVGRPSLEESIDGLYGETQCWSTVVIPISANGPADAENPNAAFRHDTYTPKENPLPFARRQVFSDPEAINKKLRQNRAIWKWQMGLFQSWQYEVEFDRHAQDGAFFVSDTMITIDDSVNDVRGVYYVQSVRKSQTIANGSRTSLTIRKPGLLNPELNALDLGGGTKGAAKVKKRGAKKAAEELDRMFAAVDSRRQ